MRDVNCAGTDADNIDEDLRSVFDSLGDNLLGIIVTEDPLAVSGLSVDDLGLVGDHRLVLAKLRARPALRQSTQYTYRDVKRIDTVVCEDALRLSVLFTAPVTSTDGYANRLADIMSAELNKAAPLRTATRCQSIRISRWLSTTAISSKH